MKAWRYLIAAGLLWLPLQGAAEEAEAPQLLGYEHKNLRSGEVTDLTALKGKPVAMMFFEPDCSWCIKQARLFAGLQEQCQQQFSTVLLGVHGKQIALKRTLFDLGVKLPAYQASKALLHDMGGIPATPIMLITDEQGRYRRYFRGMTEQEQLTPLLCG